jgi:predicted metal-binding protein
MATKTASQKRVPKLSDQQLVDRAVQSGALHAKAIQPATVQTGQWVRWKCQFGCGGYGSSLCCPPHSPTPSQTRSMLDEYQRAVLFEAPRGHAKEIAATLERELFLTGYYKALGLGSGPCRLCDTCTFDEGCRHPREARPAMEACGIDVYATARRHGFTIDVVRTRQDPQHYFGLVLVE